MGKFAEILKALTPDPRKREDRTGGYRLMDNLMGIDDGVDTPGERLGRGVNVLGQNIVEQPVQTLGNVLGGVKGDLDNLMFEGGAMQRPEAVMGYAAAPMAPGVTGARIANVLSAGGAKPGTMQEKAAQVAKMVREKYGVEPEFSYHPTSWGNSAYVNAKLPGPGGTYVGTGFRLSDHQTGDKRKGTDGVPTIIDEDGITPETLMAQIDDAFQKAQPELAARAESSARTKQARAVWEQLPDNKKKKYRKQAISQRLPGGADVGGRSLFEQEYLAASDVQAAIDQGQQSPQQLNGKTNEP